MNTIELNKYGWQFDHVHFEVMKIKPLPRKPDRKRPSMYYGTYCLVCYNRNQLDEKYYNPQEYLLDQWNMNRAIIIADPKKKESNIKDELN